MINLDRDIAIAKRACEMAGVDESMIGPCAHMAAAEYLLDRVQEKRTQAVYADSAEYRRRDEEAADRLEQLAFDLRDKAHGIDSSG